MDDNNTPSDDSVEQEAVPSAAAAASPIKGSQKPQERERYTFEFKANVIDLLENNKLSKTEILEKYKLKKRTLNQWMQKKDEIRKVYKTKRGLKTSSHQHLGKIERGIKHYFELNQMKRGNSRITITGRMLGAKAVMIKDAILERHKNGLISLEEKELNAMQSFTGSDAWGRKIALRFGLKSTVDPLEIDNETIAQRMEELRDIIAGYDPKNVFNMDETCFFYKQLPSSVYVEKNDTGRLRGTKHMTYTDRVTLYVCTNEDGSFKFPLTMIGECRKPICFKNRGKLPMKYLSQKNGWSDTKTLNDWWIYFLKCIRDYTSTKVLLIMGNCGPNASDLVDPLDQVRVKVLPASCVSKHQPINYGITSLVKRDARIAYFIKLLEAYELRHELRSQAQRLNMAPGTKGVDQGEAPHVYDAMIYLQSAWEGLSREITRQCWNDCKLRRDPGARKAEIALLTQTKFGKEPDAEKIKASDKKRDMLDLILQMVKVHQAAKHQKHEPMEEDITNESVLFEEALQGMGQALEDAIVNDSINKFLNGWYRVEESYLVRELLDQDINDEIDEVLTGYDDVANLSKMIEEDEVASPQTLPPTERTLSSEQLDCFFCAAEPIFSAMQDDSVLYGLAVEARDLLFNMKRQLWKNAQETSEKSENKK